MHIADSNLITVIVATDNTFQNSLTKIKFPQPNK